LIIRQILTSLVYTHQLINKQTDLAVLITADRGFLIMSSQFTLTLIAGEIPQRAISVVQEICQRHNINLGHTSCLSDGKKLSIQAQQFSFQYAEELAELKEALIDYSKEWEIDAVVQEAQNQQLGLACFDMDSTLIKAEVIDLLAARAGVGEKVAAITERAMRGELDFNQSFTERMQLLKGLDASVIDDIASNLPIMDGSERLFKNLNKHNVYTAILSGGFDYFARTLQEKFNIDSVLANTLDTHSNQLTGKAIPPIINADKKRAELLRLRETRQLGPDSTMAVGDGANDLAMLSCAGLGVAFRAKPVVQSQASAVLNHNGLDALLFLLGFNDRQITP